MDSQTIHFLHHEKSESLHNGNGYSNGNGNGDTSLIEYVNGFSIRPGFFQQNGAYVVSNGVGFTVTSIGAELVELALFRRYAKEPYELDEETLKPVKKGGTYLDPEAEAKIAAVANQGK